MLPLMVLPGPEARTSLPLVCFRGRCAVAAAPLAEPAGASWRPSSMALICSALSRYSLNCGAGLEQAVGACSQVECCSAAQQVPAELLGGAGQLLVVHSLTNHKCMRADSINCGDHRVAVLLRRWWCTTERSVKPIWVASLSPHGGDQSTH
jgi:hypothetical protein